MALAVENILAYEEIAELNAQLEQEKGYLLEELKTHHGFEEVVGQSRAFRKVLKAIDTVAATDATALLTGETGTGKELVVRAGHNLSPRKVKALVKGAVYVDEAHAGVVDDFDGAFQRLYLPPGKHEIEVRLDGYQTLRLAIFVSPGNTYHVRGRRQPL